MSLKCPITFPDTLTTGTRGLDFSSDPCYLRTVKRAESFCEIDSRLNGTTNSGTFNPSHFSPFLFIMETVFASDIETQDLRYVVYNNDENNAIACSVFNLVTDAIWYIQTYKPVEI